MWGIKMIKLCKKCGIDTERNTRGDCKPCAAIYSLAWRLENKEKIKRDNAIYSAKNAEKIRARSAEWYKNNPERAKAQRASWLKANRKLATDRINKWRKENPIAAHAIARTRRAKKHESSGRHTEKDIKQLVILQKGKCACCKNSIKTGHHVDHVIPLALGGSNDKLNIQLLCPTCNLSKGAKHPVDFMQKRGFLI
jgi:5-methylcytosine-specific restriction endonuclease McrA